MCGYTLNRNEYNNNHTAAIQYGNKCVELIYHSLRLLREQFATGEGTKASDTCMCTLICHNKLIKRRHLRFACVGNLAKRCYLLLNMS